ncbi:MAG: flagellar FlbD family protein [Actinomycetota bacterium]
MILVHRLKGEPFVVNADLIETVETTPDTLLRLVDGRRVAVAETPAEITARVIDFRAAIVRAADEYGGHEARAPGRAPLTVIPSEPETQDG